MDRTDSSAGFVDMHDDGLSPFVDERPVYEFSLIGRAQHILAQGTSGDRFVYQWLKKVGNLGIWNAEPTVQIRGGGKQPRSEAYRVGPGSLQQLLRMPALYTLFTA